ncbi:uncharacterized protein BT62DRAFT_1012137 [Guyanagaster necrorhizus]|uniref:Uncharacterized protein n=1 Tax=Guyanagaster necrorhizus TaxID=856835 RepID=A0A9P8AMH7_9AGAR|nr:uncharacterized protein BT62DRAFT_1012137 [Guyanagaster necrorhizus MCA 3950]KAG7440915.1 hypothetical protein BT62DRAFT_1012137 [Guyanagaster necrorhizus MCA 3950]
MTPTSLKPHLDRFLTTCHAEPECSSESTARRSKHYCPKLQHRSFDEEYLSAFVILIFLSRTDSDHVGDGKGDAYSGALRHIECLRLVARFRFWHHRQAGR